MTDDLNEKTNAELNELFAVEVAKTHVPIISRSSPSLWDGQRNYTRKRDNAFLGVAHCGNGSIGIGFWPDYCEHPDEVMPHLTVRNWYHESCPVSGSANRQSIIKITAIPNRAKTNWGYMAEAFAPTFARAAVIALIRVARTEDEDAVEDEERRAAEYCRSVEEMMKTESMK